MSLFKVNEIQQYDSDDLQLPTRTNIGTMIVGGKFVRELFAIAGNAIAPSSDFPAVCMTDFAGSKAISATNFPLLVPAYRDQKLIYLEGLAGETSSFAGSASGSVITLTDTTANNDLMAALAEYQLDFGSYTNFLTVDWNGTTYAITAIDSTARTITVTGTPTAGAGAAEIYPHRIAGSTTTARVHSMVGKTLIGAGTTEILAGLMRRDRMQLITGTIRAQRLSRFAAVDAAGALSGDGGYTSDGSASDAAVNGLRIKFYSADSPDARTSPATDTGGATHSPDAGTHLYAWGGRYAA